jgi:glycosyltransferase involved in cell wall biosynthesis
VSSSSDPIRVLGLISSTNRRGAELFANKVRNELNGNGFAVDLWALEAGATERGLDVPVLSAQRVGQGRLDLRAMRHLRSMVKDVEVVVAFGGATLTTSALATRGTGVPLVYRQIGDPAFWGSVRFADLRIGAPLRATTAVVALWQGAADELVRRYRLPPERMHVIPNARDAVLLRPPTDDEREAARAEHRVGGAPVVLYLGALSWEKRPADAIRAVAALDDVRLIVAGDGPLRSDLERLAGSIAPGRVEFTGVVADPATVLYASDALICTSATEGMAGCLLEAGLCGMPVVATDVGSASEVIADGVTGRLVSVDAPDAAAVALADVLARAEEMGEAARERTAERYSFDRVLGAWAELLRSVARPEEPAAP